MKHFGAALVLMVLYSAFLAAQSSQGRIAGRVTDSSGAIVPNATITIRNTEKGTARVLQTNSAGEYVAPSLIPGLYEITATAASFKTAQHKDIRLEVASEISIDFQLVPGSVTEVVQVSGELPEINTITDTLGGTLTNKLINELPLQGRDFQNLLELRPGIQRTPGGGFHTVTSNGNRLEDNNYTWMAPTTTTSTTARPSSTTLASPARPPAICRWTPFRNSTPKKTRAPNTAGSLERWSTSA